ncbi:MULTISPECIES: magnesium transporter [Nocardiopsis]|uniref:Magnesium transporter MgtE n=1 Tax=Nocardiopsis dassonvillei (strain ATCC 23218 / DSM 43111 / CIP 107115 / JCM 7437 / KCTC 9190 / NBRC 14626 / NCTC 10488 / NRRL B-5397 / IMRU 509) TaxID=446468 RepID=D7B3P4_NOCDD|nr:MULTISPECIES: magnesium transporter [Nocardiopsis]ADH68811.1 magnesium transporter [Nocardiopsis dassonvillei subsp. dassonvillei DSM 43111]APC36867.1 magnesium transporter [Nocardiopsis dassonvillei]ASU59809.1 magnesium transporter [Nocardiopsis dassonvillei]NKY80213.1 magnesium transporter [Nocardiopsis dassonvillei]VEI89320.1 Magnesium transporter mgtE [Nocardiopsis dassonvillei]
MSEGERAEELIDLVENNDLTGIRLWLAEHRPYEIADELSRMDGSEAIIPFRLLDKDRELEVFEELDPGQQQSILLGLRDTAFHEILEEMDPDDRARLIGEAPAKIATRALAGLSPAERRMTAALLGYPEDSVGRYMTPETVILHRDLTVGRALEVVRARGADAETIYTLPVVSDGRRMVGTVTLGDLVVSDDERLIKDIVDVFAPRVRAAEPVEDAARLMQEANLVALAVVDSEERFVGLLTFDDALEVIEAADSEDMALQSGASPVGEHYVSVGVLRLVGARSVWLMLLIVAATLTVNVMQAFESALEAVTALALFVPMLIGTGGNVGAQSATAIVRALAVGEVRVRDLPSVIWKEARVGLLLGLLLAVLALGIGSLLVGVDVAVVVACSVIAVCTWAAAIGSSMPLLARKVGVDPAVVSSPMVTTIVDATGLLIYFSIATVVLGL